MTSKLFTWLAIFVFLFSVTPVSFAARQSERQVEEGTVNVSEVQCVILTALSEMNDEEPPACLKKPKEEIDYNCSGSVNVVDVEIATQFALNQPLSKEIDANGNNIPDCKEPKPVCTEKLSKIFTVPDSFHILYDIWGSSENNVYVAASGPENKPIVFHYNGTNWTKTVLPTKSFGTATDVWGTGPNDVFVLGGGQKGFIFHYDGNTWTEMQSNTDKAFVSIWGATSKDVYAFAGANETDYFHYDGNVWSKIPIKLNNFIAGPLSVNPHFSVLWGSSSDNIFASNGDGDVFQYDGTAWEMFTQVIPGAKEIWGTDAQHVYAVGQIVEPMNPALAMTTNPTHGVIYELKDGKWNVQFKTADQEHLHDIQGGVADNLFAVGGTWDVFKKQFSPLIYHFDGSTWKKETINETFPPNKYQPVMEKLWVNHGGTDLFMLGAMTSVYHYQNCP